MGNYIKLNDKKVNLNKVVSFGKEKREFLIYDGERPKLKPKGILERIWLLVSTNSYLGRKINCNDEDWKLEKFNILNIKLNTGETIKVVTDQKFKDKIETMVDKLKGVDFNYRGIHDDYNQALIGARHFDNNFLFCSGCEIETLEEKLNKYFN